MVEDDCGLHFPYIRTMSCIGRMFYSRWQLSFWFWAILRPVTSVPTVIAALLNRLRLVRMRVYGAGSCRMMINILPSLLRILLMRVMRLSGLLWVLIGGRLSIRVGIILRLLLTITLLLLLNVLLGLLSILLGLLVVLLGRLLWILLRILIVAVPLGSLVVLRPL